ncbi:unnamed protein product [Penicillium salamii]|uniref:Uncharacterized protein n=2 Tax=Penicillium TaxID=5073 RepID=A0A9W4I8V0_9EURO|nr:hypothetical protein HAV15_009092 [Penicillium sp. str. \
MPISIFDSSASNPSTQSAMEAYTHAMQAHALSQISFLGLNLGLSENHGINDRDSDDVRTSDVLYEGPSPPDAAETEEATRQAANGAEYTQA